MSDVSDVGRSLRTFHIRACPVCGKVAMPKYRDDNPRCSGFPDDHNGERSAPRLAWFEVEEIDSLVNALNADARAGAEPHRGYPEFHARGDGRIWMRNWATGESGFFGETHHARKAKP